MNLQLDLNAVRILGCLIEKEITTPDYYPMSLNSLVNACNQKSNREPVMQLSSVDVECGVDVLRDKHLAWKRSVAGARVYKYEHNIKSVIPLTDKELAIICTLFLRGAQTIGEIRTRCERVYAFDSIEDADATVQKLITRSDGPLVLELPRQPGRKEPRYIHTFCGEEWAMSQGVSASENSSNVMLAVPEGKSAGERITFLEEEVENLKSTLSELSDAFYTFKKLLE